MRSPFASLVLSFFLAFQSPKPQSIFEQAGLFSFLSNFFHSFSSTTSTTTASSNQNSNRVNVSVVAVPVEPPPSTAGDPGEENAQNRELKIGQTDEIEKAGKCAEVTHKSLPTGTQGISTTDVSAYNQQLVQLNTDGFRTKTGTTAPLKVFIPVASALEFNCFLGAPPPGVNVTDCAAPVVPSDPKAVRFTCKGDGSACWTKTAKCPAGTTLSAIRAICDSEHVVSIESKLNSVPWGKVRAYGGQWGDVEDSEELGLNDPSFKVCAVNNAGPRPYPIDVPTGAPVDFKIADPTNATVTFGCRDQDSTNDGECTIIMDLACEDPNASSSTTTSTTQPVGKKCWAGL